MSATTSPGRPVAPHPDAAGADRHPLRVMALLATLMGFGSISTDLYLPAMPAMARELGAANGALEFTISGYLIGFSLGQLLWGALSDKIGRRLPIAIGILLFIIGSAGCALSDSAAQVIGWRVVQAVGAPLPEFDFFGEQSVASPEGRQRYVVSGEPLLGLQQACLQQLAPTQWLALLRRPGAEACSFRAGREVSGALFFGYPFHGPRHPDLAM